jgi:putative DNA primase/helicase
MNTAKIRYIDTSGLPPGFDVADLIAQGTTGQALLDWCRERVREGMPPAEERPQPVRTPKPEAAQKKAPSPRGSMTGPGASVDLGEAERTATIPKAPAPSTPTVVVSGNVAHIQQRDPAPEPEPGMPPQFSQDALADTFADRHADSLLYVPTWGRWMLWSDSVWVHDEKLSATHLSRRICREAANEVLLDPALAKIARSLAASLTSSNTIHAVEKLARSDPRIVAGTKQWDHDIWAVNTPGGIVDLRNGSIRAARRDDFVTRTTSATPGGDCPTWREFLRVATDGDDQLIEYLQRVAGYCLTGSTREQVLFFFYGTGGNGKGTFLNTLDWLFNDYSRAASTKMFMDEKFRSDDSFIAGLMGARFVTAQEVPEDKRWDEERLKSMTGGDKITAKFLHSNPFDYVPQFKLVFSGNHKPGLRNVDDAIRRRFRLIPFTVTVPPEKKDVRLYEKLKDEASGILQWCVDGAADWYNNTLATPETVSRATETYFEAEDTLGQFLSECCEFDRNARSKTADVYKRYGRWCESNNEYALPRKRWLQQLAHHHLESYKHAGEMVMDGVRLRYAIGDHTF